MVMKKDEDLDNYLENEDKDFNIFEFLKNNPTAKELFDCCFRQLHTKYYFSIKLQKFENIENEKQLISLIAYDYPEFKKVEISKTGKEIVSLTLPKEFLDITFFMNSIDMVKTSIDPFQKENVIFKRFDRVLELTTNKLYLREPELEDIITDEMYNIVVEDYKQHFKLIDDFLLWIIACRFTNNRRSSYAHLWVTAGFGKSFLSACFKKLGILTECRYEDFKSPSSLSPFELRNSWIILIDEFSIFKKEFKNMTNEMIVDAKNQLRTIVEVYAKVFLSAEQSPSFEDGVDKQITDRVQQIKAEVKPLEKREVYIKYSNTVYLQCVSKYIYSFISDKVKELISLGKIEADKQSTIALNTFLDKFKLQVENLDDVIFQLFYEKIFTINNENDFDSLSRNDQIIKKEHIFHKGKDIIIYNCKKVLKLILEQEDENFKKKAWYKTYGLDVVLKVPLVL